MRSRAGRHALVAASLAATATLAAAPLDAQVVRGRLLDHTTGRAIARGTVLLRDTTGDVAASTVTGNDGRYHLRAPRPGAYTIEALRIGYVRGSDGPLVLAAGDDWDTEFRLRPTPVRLPAVDVAAERARVDSVHLSRVGFLDRQRSDFGHFMTRDVIERRAAHRVSDLLSGIPGVRTIMSSGGSGRASVELRGSVLSGGGVCHPRVFIDGLIVIRGDARPRGQTLGGEPEALGTETAVTSTMEREEIALDDVVQPYDIEAIEVYRAAAQVPVQFGGGSIATQCGVIVIWTRRGRP